MRYIDNDRVITAHVAAEEAALACVVTDRYARPEDPHADAAHEHAVEGFALACRDLVEAINTGDPREWPIGWACGEVQTWYPNGTDPASTEPCRLRPDHDGMHDWAIAEDAAEAVRLRREVELMRPVVDAAKTWRGQFVKPSSTKLPRAGALMDAVDALLNTDQPAPQVEVGR